MPTTAGSELTARHRANDKEFTIVKTQTTFFPIVQVPVGLKRIGREMRMLVENADDQTPAACPHMARRGPNGSGRACLLCPGSSDVNLFRYGKGIIDLDARSGQYYESIDLIDAFHPQTILAHRLNDVPLSAGHGAPLRLRVERQLGYKHAKYAWSAIL